MKSSLSGILYSTLHVWDSQRKDRQQEVVLLSCHHVTVSLSLTHSVIRECPAGVRCGILTQPTAVILQTILLSVSMLIARAMSATVTHKLGNLYTDSLTLLSVAGWKIQDPHSIPAWAGLASQFAADLLLVVSSHGRKQRGKANFLVSIDQGNSSLMGLHVPDLNTSQSPTSKSYQKLQHMHFQSDTGI